MTIWESIGRILAADYINGLKKGNLDLEEIVGQLKARVAELDPVLPTVFPILSMPYMDLKSSMDALGIEWINKDKFTPDMTILYTDVASWQRIVPFLVSPADRYVEEGDDCVTGDTPVWVRYQGRVGIVETRELLPFALGTEIYTRLGFVPLLKVRRKSKKRPTIRLLGTSDIALTPDHKVVARPNLLNGKYIEAKDIVAEDLIKNTPLLPAIGKDDYEFGWVLGSFCAEGTALMRHGTTGQSGATWSIRQCNSDYQERAMATLNLHYPDMGFYIKSFPSEDAGVQTNLGIRKSKIYHLLVKPKERHNDGSRNRFVSQYRQAFYNRFKVKRVPEVVLNGSKTLTLGFWDSMVAHDGHDGRVTSSSKLETMALCALIQKLGKEPSATDSKGKYGLVAMKDNPGHFWGGAFVRYSRPSRWKLDNGMQWVYDLTTANGEFVAGDIAIKNCDDYAKFASGKCSMLFGLNGCLDIWGDTPDGYHGFCAVVIGPGKFKLFEPNSGFEWAGELFEAQEHGYVPEAWR